MLIVRDRPVWGAYADREERSFNLTYSAPGGNFKPADSISPTRFLRSAEP